MPPPPAGRACPNPTRARARSQHRPLRPRTTSRSRSTPRPASRTSSGFAGVRRAIRPATTPRGSSSQTRSTGPGRRHGESARRAVSGRASKSAPAVSCRAGAGTTTAWGIGVRGIPIYFATTGVQRVRVQQREDGLSIDQIVLSPTTYRTTSPGLAKNDATILPEAGVASGILRRQESMRSWCTRKAARPLPPPGSRKATRRPRTA